MQLRLVRLLLLVAVVLVTVSCSSNKEGNPVTPPSSSRNVTYEITGNYTGHFRVVYANKTGGYNTITVSSLPWSLSFTADAGVPAATFTVNPIPGQPGVVSQTATAKIVIGDREKGSSNGTAGADGYILNLSPGTFTF